MNPWIARWLAATLLCLAALAGSAIYLLQTGQPASQREQDALAQTARVKVNELLLYLERNMYEIRTGTHDKELAMLSRNGEIDVLVLALDGSVLFDSTGAANTAYNPRLLLTYDRLANDDDFGRYNIAYPIIDEREDTQIGNAIFSMSRLSLSSGLPSPVWFASTPYLLPAVLAILLAGLLLLMAWKMRNRMMHPLLKLKDHSEQILKGDYGEIAKHDKQDEIGELYAVFDQMRAEIKHLDTRRMEQDQARKELITNISHDLKTPLTTVKAYIEAIREGVCPDMESVMAYVDVMKTNTDKMSRLTEDLLLHALQDLGQISVHLREQYSLALFEDMIKPIAHFARSTGVIIHEPRSIPDVLISADAQRLEQVIGNLVMNALKHTKPEDTIRIEIERTADDLAVTIADTGAGISPEDMPFVFERYYQGRSNGAESALPTDGSGLGLSICKHIVEAHHGMISFRSVRGEGTRFTFTIPVL
ncbi:sensor histidine kinase [Paenibacillus sp. NPDC057967]|uniref:sensor histidine kinase n=1 Tax=Paenibacillus sp. NPDC057967 TaxID=3346293 RepID=UPI0036D8B418